MATTEDLPWFHEPRHRVYAQEPGQRPPDPSGRRYDGLDGDNVCPVVAHGPARTGFVSVTPPWTGRYALEKYLTREELPVLSEDGVFEVRLLTVEPERRSTGSAALLMHAALRWVAARGGRRVVATGRTELLTMYLATGLRPVGRTVRSGAPSFEVLTGSASGLSRAATGRYRAAVARLRDRTDWRLDTSFASPSDGCEHGGASFTAIGTDSADLDRRHRIVAADVLDAWFPPAPGVRAALAEDPGAARLVAQCRRQGVYLRDLSPLSPYYEGRAVRTAVRDTGENARTVAACRDALETLRPGPASRTATSRAATTGAVAAGPAG